jgi:hypothetical protein
MCCRTEPFYPVLHLGEFSRLSCTHAFTLSARLCWALQFITYGLVCLTAWGCETRFLLIMAKRYGTALAHRVALLALIGYLVIVIWGSVTAWPFE